MSSAWFYELSQRLDEEMEKEAAQIAVGTCVTDGTTRADVVAMNYRERVGFLSGLRRAYQVAEALEKGK
jgi:hypothetical protein